MDTAATPASPTTLVHSLEEASALDAAVGRLEPLAASATSGGAGALLRGTWLGHALHPVLTDLPIGCWTSAWFLDLVGGKSSRRAAQRLIGLGLAFVPITAATGVADWSDTTDRRVQRVGVVHAAGNGAAALLYFGSWRARRRGHHLRGVVLGMAGATAATVAGYLGGHMAFARGAGQGPREEIAPTPLGEHQLIDARTAADLLNVDLARLQEMVDGDLLVPVAGSGAAATFEPADVLAARLVGG